MTVDTPYPDHPPHPLVDPVDARRWLDREKDDARAQLAGVERGDRWSDSTTLAVQATEARQRLTEIDRAAERLENGAFGTCEGCERPIPPERLEIKPSARRCVGCLSAD